MQEVRTSLNEILQIRKVAIATLRDLMAKHELDERYQNKVNYFYLFFYDFINYILIWLTFFKYKYYLNIIWIIIKYNLKII